MKRKPIIACCLAFLLLASCSKEKAGTTIPASTVSTPAVKEQIQKLTEALSEAERNDELAPFLAFYDKDALSMPEYQPTLQGIREIESFYKEIFQRQQIKAFRRTTDEVIDLGRTKIEIGTFTKEYTTSNSEEAVLTQDGKYWHVWEVQANGNLKLKGESFGFFHPIVNPEFLVVQPEDSQTAKPEVYLDQKIPFELKAYNALMEKGVRSRDGAFRSEFFTDDAIFMPFAEPNVVGMEEIKPYMIGYSSRGEVTIDSIACYTYHYDRFEDYILEYPKFKVKWSAPPYSGRVEGKGIRIWKRQDDQSLKLYREISSHNHLEEKSS